MQNQTDPRGGPPARFPGPETTGLGRFTRWLEVERGRSFASYEDLWRWSVDDLEGFWTAVWEFFGVPHHAPAHSVLAGGPMPEVTWFDGATINYAEVALGGLGPGTVIRSVSQSRPTVELTSDELHRQVGAARAGLVALGVGRGDRVAAYLPNIAETVVAFLATASLGAVWVSCAPEFGVRSVLDRLSQVGPTVLLAVDGYRYGDREIDRREDLATIRAALPTLAATVMVPYLHGAPEPAAHGPDTLVWADLVAQDGPVTFELVPFEHPLWILFSSGTTGLPKAIVQGHGGIVLEHLKALGIHANLGPSDRFFWFTTTGWMMWNFLVSGLMVGASIVLFDGDPVHPDPGALWRLVEELEITYFGTSASFLLNCRKLGLRPADVLDLHALHTVGSTGSPLPAEGFEWVWDAVGGHVAVSSISGGTDVCTAFVGGTPPLPVRAGESTCRYLGARVEAFDRNGDPVVGRQGELVVTAPMPSMPVSFWGDPDGRRLRSAYFATFPGVWRHGDWVTITPEGACVISGRSDAVLNRGGVRLGTADFYSVVEELPQVADSLVVHLEDPADSTGRLILFVVMRAGEELDDGLRNRIAATLRANLSPRHVPDVIQAIGEVPRTVSGKKVEVPVKRILRGEAPDDVVARGALANPRALDEIARLVPLLT